MSPSCGSKWMSETPRSTASVMMRCTSWMTDASSPAEPKSIGRSCSRMSYIGPAFCVRPGRGGVGDLDLLLVVEVEQHGGVLGVLEALEQPLDVLARGHRGAHLVAGHDRDVVDREHVRGVRHRDQQRAFGDERHGHGLVALDRCRGDELGRVGVDLVVADRDVVEPEALRDRARELVVGDRTLRQQDALRRRSGRVGLLDGVVHDRSLDEPEVDEDVREHPAGAATPRRGRDAPFSACWVQPRSVSVGSWTWRCCDGLPHRHTRGHLAGPAFERRNALCQQHLQPVDDACPLRTCRFEESRLAGSVDHVDHAASGLERIGLERKRLERINVGVKPDADVALTTISA